MIKNILTTTALSATLFANQFVMGGAKHDEANDVLALKDGYILAGYNSSVNKSGSKNVWIVKNSYDHKMIWQKYWGGIHDDGAYAITETDDSEYLVAGFSKSKGSGDKDILLLIVDKKGDIKAEKIYGGAELDQIKSIAKSDDGYMLVGTSRSYTHGANDGILLKVDKNLNKTYLKHFGERKDDNLIAITKVANHYIAVGDTKNNTAGSSDGWILKLDSDGNILKELKIGGKKFEFFTSVVANSDGGYTILGYGGTDTKGISDMMLIRYDKSDKQMWSIKLGGKKFEKSKKVIADGNGGYLVVGITKSFGAIKNDGYIANVDKNGKLLWQKHIGKDGTDMLYSARVDHEGNYIICGEYGSDSAMEGDVWAIRVDKSGNIIK